MNAAVQSTPQPFRTVDGKYALHRELGSGGAGTVYEAEHLIVGKRVAIKLMHAELAQDAGLQARFVAEARAAARIAHANVVDIFDLGVSRDGTPYMVMELLDGETLMEVVERRGAMAPAYACELLLQVLAGLAAAHAQGIVHRDLKPANIIVTHPRPDRPLVKVLDFGIAKGVIDAAGEEGMVFGTPMYMAPEQAMARPVDARADIYSAGAILYELLGGASPFVGETPEEVMREALLGRGRPLAEVAPDIPPRLVAVVEAAMALDPDARPQNVSELAARLLPFVADGVGLSMNAAAGVSAPPIPLVAATRTSAQKYPSLDFVRRDLGCAVPYDVVVDELTIPRAPTTPRIEAVPEPSAARLPQEPEQVAARHAPTELTRRRAAGMGARAVVLATMVGFSVGMLAAWAAGLL